MKRPFKDKRLFGPVIGEYSAKPNRVPNKIPPDANMYIATVYLSGDVMKYSQERADFAQFVRAAFREYGLFYSTYRGWTQESPYKDDKYLCEAETVELPSDTELSEMIDMINDRVGGLSAPEFRVQDIQFDLKS